MKPLLDEAGTPASASNRYAASAAPVDPASWEELVSGFDDASYDQTNAYGGHLWGQANLSQLILRRDGAVVAAAQVVLLRPPLIRRGLAYVKFGPLWRRKHEPADPETLTAMLEALKAEYAVRRGLLLTVLPVPDPVHHDQWHSRLAALGFRRRRRMTDPNRYLVDLSIGREAQHRSLQQKWRYNLGKSLAHGLTMRRVEGGLATFDALYRSMVARKRFVDHSGVGALEDLGAKLPPSMQPRLYVGEQEGRPTVAAIVGLIGDTAYYLYGATDDRALASKAGYALQWWIVGELEGSAHWYDLGGEAGEPGLRQFKKGLVGKRGVVLPMLGESDFWTSSLGRWTGDAIYAARAARHTARRLVMNGLRRPRAANGAEPAVDRTGAHA